MDKIVCIGKNNKEHAVELGDAVPEKPVLFIKPPSTLVRIEPGKFPTPVASVFDRGALHHELELVLELNQDLYQCNDESRALASIHAVGLGLDMTLRDEQAKAKKNGHPWEIGKTFRSSTLLGPLELFAPSGANLFNREYQLFINGTLRQKGFAHELWYSPLQVICFASQTFELKKGDLLFTGTPKGVGPVHPGDEAQVYWDGQLQFCVQWNQ